MISGIEDLMDYSKKETNQEVVKVVKQKVSEFFLQAEQMKLEVKALKPPEPKQEAPQPQNFNQA